MIQPKLQYAAVVWSPHKKKKLRNLERIQGTAAKTVPKLKDLKKLDYQHCKKEKCAHVYGETINLVRALA